MNAAESQRQRQLPDLDTLDVQSLKALVLAKQAELDSHTTEIENLKLLILKLKRMHFGPRSEKYDRDIKQLEFRLEDLEASKAAAEPPPVVAATVVLKQRALHKPARRPLPAGLPRETETIAPAQEACPDCGGKLRWLGEDVSEALEFLVCGSVPNRAFVQGGERTYLAASVEDQPRRVSSKDLSKP